MSQTTTCSFFTFLCLLFCFSLAAQTTTFDVDFEEGTLGQPPLINAGSGSQPTGIFPNGTTDIVLAPFTGNAGTTGAAGQVAQATVTESGNFRLLDFDGLLNGGLISSDTVIVGFDFLAEAGADNAGFAFLRSYDETGESFADLGFNFSGDGYSIFLLDYDAENGEYLGGVAAPFPANSFDAGTWHRFELVIDLNENRVRLLVDGTDWGVDAGISRATGTGYAGAFFNWGTTIVGRYALDNFRVTIPATAGLPAPPAGFTELLTPDAQGGTVIRLPGGDFRQPGLEWGNGSSAQLSATDFYQGVSGYRITVDDGLDEADRRLFASGSFPYLPNRTYEVSALVRTNFPRATWEINIGMHGITPEGELAEGERLGGLPAITEGPDGWQRWTWQFTPHWEEPFSHLQAHLGLHEYGPGFDGNVLFEIADLAFVELPAVELAAFAPGQGVTFPGGAGEVPMAVESVEDTGDLLTVTSTAAVYEFDRTGGTLTVRQRIDMQRALIRLYGLPLNGLNETSSNADVAVLVGNDLTIGVQADGMLTISPHQEITTEIESLIGGDFNRLATSDLLCEDDFGGFTANIYVPKGTGQLARLEALTPNLPFIGLAADDLNTTAAADSGWRVVATVSPGERLFVSAFPSRPYNWQKSFEFQWAISDYQFPADEYDDPDYMTDWILWNFTQRAWAMSFGTEYTLRDDVDFAAHKAGVESVGDKWSTYFSQWFYYSRDAAEWAGEAQRWRDTYGMSAIYSDGLAQDDWLSAYEAMRRLRADVFPDGDIVIHDSYPQSGIPGAAFKPFIYAYATSTYMGENADAEGPRWPWARYAMNQFRRSNALGVTKGDRWEGVEGVEKYLIALVWGGRGRPDVAGYNEVYLPILDELRAVYEDYGDDPFFFDRYYHPRAQTLTGFEIGRAGMPIVVFDTLVDGTVELQLSTWTPGATIHYTLDGSEPSTGSPAYTTPLPWTDGTTLLARAFKDTLDESRRLELNADVGVAATDPVGAIQQPQLLPLSPNPAGTFTLLHYALPRATDVSIEVIDLLGRRVSTQRIGRVAAGGGHYYRLDTQGLAAGTYAVRLHTGSGGAAVRYLVVR
ncbi:MAG: chitobiase/beta-hexosaminidase C-terminal domain-containing protein [Saprospiraceae bacterium]